ncbi:hypothetical protein DPMN_052110 [Dreissena polymorpha]|uniref:Uncharacterized protein n=1 Tax=Dreissena polymorpha TaxID=45954 RepID=A0A9D4HMR2_DREPO|nr:hypothetical protein DPMN_052110 [Dreissena polymorpha]
MGTRDNTHSNEEQNDQTPTEHRDKLPVKRNLISSDASEEIDLMNNAAKQKIRKKSNQTLKEPLDKLLVQRSLIPSDASEDIDKVDNAAKHKPSNAKPVDKSAVDLSTSGQETNTSTFDIPSSYRKLEKRIADLEKETQKLK